jgi:hypothetical protein
VYDDAALTHGVPCDGVAAAAPHRCRQVVLPTEPHRRHHMGNSPAAGDQCRPPLDVPVPDLPSDVVARFAWLDELAREVRGQRLDGSTVDRRHLALLVSAPMVIPVGTEEKCSV